MANVVTEAADMTIKVSTHHRFSHPDWRRGNLVRLEKKYVAITTTLNHDAVDHLVDTMDFGY